VAIDTGFYCTTRADIGDYVHIGPYVTIIGGAQGVFRMKGLNTVGAGSRLLCATDEFRGAGLPGITPRDYRDKVRFEPIIFEMFASIGTNVVVHPGVTLAEGSVVGSCSLVTKSTDPWTIYVGIPARPLKRRRKATMIAMARELGYV
jgi:acetyltransferase-like isoleucine patch superfamily enzyme